MNDGSAAGLIIVLVILLLLSAFFSATETAYTSFSQARMKRLAADGKKAAVRALKLGEDYDSVLSTLLIGNNIVNITAASLATLVFTHYFGNLGVTLSTVVMTVLVLIFGEISPKSLAKERPEEFAMFASAPLYGCKIVLWPLNFLFNLWKKLLNKIFRLQKKPSLTEEEFKIIVTDIKNEGVLNETEHELIQKTLHYDDTLVSAVMVPLAQVTSIAVDWPADRIKALFEESNFSRVPVLKGDSGEIIGMLYRADFYELLLNGGSDITSILRPIMWTSPEIKISQLFQRMQREKHHMAIVRKDMSVLGLVTMEDLLEELMGEIEDEYDSESNFEDPIIES